MTSVFPSGAALRQIVLDAIVREVPELTPDMHRVFASMFRDGPTPMAQDVARAFDFNLTTFCCRFHRGRCPSPKVLLRWSGLLRIAHARTHGTCHGREAAFLAGIAGREGLSRWLTINFGLTARQARALGFEGALEQFLRFAIRPHRAALSHLHPLTKVPASDPRRTRALARRAA